MGQFENNDEDVFDARHRRRMRDSAASNRPIRKQEWGAQQKQQHPHVDRISQRATRSIGGSSWGRTGSDTSNCGRER